MGMILKTAVIGVGNCGGQVASLASEKGISAVAMNTSDKDLSHVGDIPKIIIGEFRGAGKDRNFAKKTFKPVAQDILSDESLIEVIQDKDLILVVGATNGATGSAIAPIMAATLRRLFPGKVIVCVGVLGSLRDESIIAQQNGIDFTQDLEKAGVSYMLYDNDLAESKLATYEAINNKIVQDIITLSGANMAETQLDSIDDRDLKDLLSTPGRIVVGSVALKSRDTAKAEKLLIADVKHLATPLADDKVVGKMGLSLAGEIAFIDSFDKGIINDEFGDEAKDFNNIAIVDSIRMAEVILTGLSAPVGRIEEMIKRVDEFSSKERTGFGSLGKTSKKAVKNVLKANTMAIEADSLVVAEASGDDSKNDDGGIFNMGMILDMFDDEDDEE